MSEYNYPHFPLDMDGLLFAGPSAVEEFIAAVAHVRGDAAARPMRRWWEERRAAD